MSKKTATKTPATKPAPKFVLAKKLRLALPDAERGTADEVLWAKSGGLCALCGRPLQPAEAEADHRDPVSGGGSNSLLNLHLAHPSCNRARGNLNFSLARPIVEFRVFADEKKAISFDDVLDRYVAGNGSKTRQPVGVTLTDDTIELACDGYAAKARLFTDPATGVKYFFHDIPVSVIKNDVEVQPRVISYAHVRALALDFDRRPVHEPSNCRLVQGGEKTASLLQFDGQHKTTAQILIGRSIVPMKVYIEPPVSMVQALVLKIQQEIKKQPLTKSDTLAKLGDVIKRRLDDYLSSAGAMKTEEGFIAAQPASERKEVKKELQQELQRLVFFDDTNLLAKAVKPGATGAPTTDKVVIERIIKPLLHQQLLEIDMEASGGRDSERELLVLILNTIAEKMLPEGWNTQGNDLARRRAQNFFYQGSIGWWMVLLQDALKYVLQRIKSGTPLLIDVTEQKDRDQAILVVEKLCDLQVWSTDNPEDLKAMRSNTVKNVEEQFPKVDWRALIP